ncbi:uncharacterized protein LOC124115791 [Haliotis rufescens]|uniref:uncharacterized protein LOC124115791 n=1 Tax=Haliotis rufescens TaxID=6454 RepID=UPI00201EC8D4|nr:uncharacterized protein LOC124115791 [Haliotis rufescens]
MDIQVAASPQEDVVAKILNKSKSVQKLSKGGKTYTFFNVIGATEKEVKVFRIYQCHKFSTIFIGKTYKFVKVTKREGTLIVNSNCPITFTAPITVPDHLRDEMHLLPEDVPTTGTPSTISEALQTAGRSAITGKVVQISPPKYARDSALPIRCLSVKDSTSTVKVCLFERNAEMTFSPSDTVQLTGLYKSTYQGFLPDAANIQVNPEDKLDDPDFQTAAAPGLKPGVSITEFLSVSVYECCRNQKCRKKKLVSQKCPTCQLEDKDTPSKTCFMSLMYKHNEQPSKFSIFQEDLEKLIGETCNLDSEESLVEQIANKLPLTFSCVIQKGTFQNVSI